MASRDRYYRVLDLPPGAEPDEVRAAWRDLVQVWHPDRFAGNERLQLKAEETLKQINEAYEKLTRGGDETARKQAYEPEMHQRGASESSHIEILGQGVQAWNLWRKKYMDVVPQLTGARLAGRALEGVDLRETVLTGAVLERADLYKANASLASFHKARMGDAVLHRAILIEADFSGADLTACDLTSADLRGAKLDQARVFQAKLLGARLEGADLAGALGLSPAQLEHVSTDAETRLPAHF